jgi:hypothetical protein
MRQYIIVAVAGFAASYMLANAAAHETTTGLAIWYGIACATGLCVGAAGLIPALVKFFGWEDL